jgi:hypothetical protein
MFAVTSCTGGPNARCVDIVDDAIGVFQELIAAVDELDLAEAAAAGEEFTMPGMDDMERRADTLQDEAEAAGCDDDELRQLLTERVGRLEARTVFGQAVIEGIRQEGLFEQ